MTETRLVELVEYNTNGRKFFAKIEADNPTGSMKDRMVEYCIKKAEEGGELKQGMTIIEASSGNTGIALAKIGHERGYRVVICVPQNISNIKKKMIEKNGGEYIEIDTGIDNEADINTARRWGNGNQAYFFNQFENFYHVKAYYENLGEEVVKQLNKMDITIDVLVAGVGTGGSLRGLGERLRNEHNPNLGIHAVIPKDNPTKIEGLHPGHIKGWFKIWEDREKEFTNGPIFIDDGSAIKRAIEINKNPELWVGVSSGAVLEAAIKEIGKKGNYLLLFGDSGNRYGELFTQYL